MKGVIIYWFHYGFIKAVIIYQFHYGIMKGVIMKKNNRSYFDFGAEHYVDKA